MSHSQFKVLSILMIKRKLAICVIAHKSTDPQSTSEDNEVPLLTTCHNEPQSVQLVNKKRKKNEGRELHLDQEESLKMTDSWRSRPCELHSKDSPAQVH